MGHDIARHELVAAQHFVSGSEILGEPYQEAAKAATPLVQALDGLNAVIGRADNPLSCFYQMLKDFLDRAVELHGPSEGLPEIFPVESPAAHAQVVNRLFA